MAEEQTNFDDLSTAEVKKLYQQTRAAAIKQRGIQQAQVQAQNDFGIDADYHLDPHGYVVPGPKPPVKHIQTYVDSSGYVQELREGEKPPSQGTTMLDRVTAFVNANALDPDVKELLPEDLSVFEEQSVDFPDYLLFGTLRGKKWHVTALNEKDDARAFKFVLTNDLDRDHAIAAAHNYLENQVGPKFRKLTQMDVHKIQRLAASNRDAALSLYVCACLPKQWEQEFVRLGAEAEITGSTMKLLEFTANPEINRVVEEGVYACWYWSKPEVELTSELDAFIQKKTADRVLTFALLDSLFQKFQASRAIKHLGSAADAGPSLEDLETLTDAEVEDLHRRTRLALARANR